MKRRKALQQISLGLSAGLMMPQLLTACKKDDPGPEVPFDGNVVIIGAGAAGLFAADILHTKGIKVSVLEASNQLGGRIQSFRNSNEISDSLLFDMKNRTIADFPVELGAEIVFGPDSSWGKIISNLNLSTVSLETVATNRFILDQSVKTAVELQGDSDFLQSQTFVNELPNYSSAAVSMKQAISGLSRRTDAILNSQIGNYYGTSNDTLGISLLSQDLKARTHDGKVFSMKANPMQDILLSRFSEIQSLVETGKQVKSINYGSDPIVITLKDGSQVEADKVISTVPISILKGGGISFSPALPGEMTSALSRMGMDATVRLVLDFKKNFWGEDSGFIWGGTTAPHYFSTGIGRSEFYRTISITINGAKAAELSAKGPDLMIAEILAELDALYAGQATLFVRRNLDTTDPNFDKIIYILKDWSKDEHFKGGYSYPLASATTNDRIALGKPVSNKLFFAGEATDVGGDAGTVSGALSSGARVSEEVIKSILGIS
ncbi:MAG: FAD-dependent oxidoreductase [Bacteroidia bacterium]|nr:FAD-dependent oxidoreductase [Bacteroidia bacterium]